MTETDRRNTRAFWATSKMRVSVSVYFMAYADHAKKALDESPTVPRSLFSVPQDFNLIEEARRNKELHASMDFMRLLLKEPKYSKNKGQTDKPKREWDMAKIIEPKVRVIPPEGGHKISPMERAKQIGKSYKELGDWITNILEQQQWKLHDMKFPFSYVPQDEENPRPSNQARLALD